MRRLDCRDLFVGVTTAEERRERVRRLILERRCDQAIAGRRDGHSCETWSELFTRVYGVPLVPAAANPASRAATRDARAVTTTGEPQPC